MLRRRLPSLRYSVVAISLSKHFAKLKWMMVVWYTCSDHTYGSSDQSGIPRPPLCSWPPGPNTHIVYL
ncbi:23072_t:CDS:2 [Rhizophagus irregularis]|nr:23072_t:CDS:2 [Rhizophagus irregularis]